MPNYYGQSSYVDRSAIFALFCGFLSAALAWLSLDTLEAQRPLAVPLFMPLLGVAIGFIINLWWPEDQDVRHAKVWAAVGQGLGAVLLPVALMAILRAVIAGI
ncbi:hypothetical protein [Polymorphobacter megasporae]|uniref:hypothetical protein n=1 Tax=Glacieibacterium megasporae TaxID=2835787 RepID=UPI001C1E076D|nr:hypothetical protein [Polymorphobacter megasporae]UAJ12994.1 hypothetical protein KTC28_22440 [Polymorphobacter megasporae]